MSLDNERIYGVDYTDEDILIKEDENGNEYVESEDFDAANDQRNAIINDKLDVLRKGIKDGSIVIHDDSHPGEKVIDFRLGHYADGDYSLAIVLDKSGEQPGKTFTFDNLVAELDGKLERQSKTDPKIEKLRAETSQYAIEHITRKGMHTGIKWLEDSFNDYYKAISAPGAKLSPEAEISHRQILAQKVAIDCIHALNKEQLEQLDKVLDGIAKDINISNGLKR